MLLKPISHAIYKGGGHKQQALKMNRNWTNSNILIAEKVLLLIKQEHT